MLVNRTIYALEQSEIESHPLITRNDSIQSFYSWLREQLAVSEDDKIDCTKIRVAKNIEDAWVKHAEEEGMDNISIGMTLLNYAPRVDETLSDNEVCIFADFIVKS